jgi:sulfur relay (sulfurtransferase) complex TusBCD TusD component (DsrE family)
MSSYLLIASRDPLGDPDGRFVEETARSLVSDAHQVTVFLIQNGVFAARAGAETSLARLTDVGVQVLADAFSLRERGIPDEKLAPGVRPAALDVIIDGLAQGVRTIWH